MKKILLSLLVASMLVAGTGLDCKDGVCKAEETVSFMGYKIYEIGYEACRGEEKIKLKYNIDVAKEKNNAKLMEKFLENNKPTLEERRILSLWMSKTKDARKGTTYEVICSKEHTELKIDGVSMLLLKDGGKFGRHFLNIWAGEEPVDEALSQKIISARSIVAGSN